MVKWIICTIVICIIATVGILIKQQLPADKWYLCGWICGCISIALCDIIKALFSEG